MGSRYELPAGARLRVLTGSGKVSVKAEDRTDVEVDPPERSAHITSGPSHDQRGARHGIFRRRRQQSQEEERQSSGRPVLEVKSKSGSVTVRCPIGLNVSVGAMSGSVHIEGEVGSVKISTISGSIEIDAVRGDIDARCISGSIRVGDCRGNCNVHTKSGSITIGAVTGELQAATISGSIEVTTAGKQDVELRTVSGGMKVRVPPDRHPSVRLRSVSGRVRGDHPQGDDFNISASSVSGSVEIVSP